MSIKQHEIITNRILDQLRAGIVPWRQPWSGKGAGAMPRNATTRRAYSGVNVLLLWGAQQEKGYASAEWLTFKQALELGGNVRKGEKGCGIIYVSTMEREDNETGETINIPFLKGYTVFNTAQCENLPAGYGSRAPSPITNTDRRDDLADDFLASTGADIRHGEGRAYYRRDLDFIMLPDFETFTGSDAYYATAFHELAHWTGAPHRLDRTKGKRFGDREYAFEELVAELAASFLSAEFAMDHVADAASYIGSWISLMQDHPTAIVAAASQASKATAFLRDLAIRERELAA